MPSDNQQGGDQSGFFSMALKQLFGDSPKDLLPGSREGATDTPVEAADDMTLRREWRKQKIRAMETGEDFPAFSEYRAQRQGQPQ